MDDLVKEFFDRLDSIEDTKTKKKKHRCSWPDCKNLALININDEKQSCKKHLLIWMNLLSERETLDSEDI